MRQMPACPQSRTRDPKIPPTAERWPCKVCGAEGVNVIHSAELPPMLEAHKDVRVPPAYRRAHLSERGSPKQRKYTGR
jgi:hypothetical protein